MVRRNEDLIKYNANKYDKNVGDCVLRSISLALNMPYRDVEKEIKALAKERNSKFNHPFIYDKYLRSKGIVDSVVLHEKITVQEFSEQNNTGIYCVTCGKRFIGNTADSTHMVCIMNGDIYDSWDCRSWYVDEVYVISEEEASKIDSEQYNADFFTDKMLEYVDEYSAKWLRKYNKYFQGCADIVVIELNTFKHSDYSVNCKIKLTIDNNDYINNGWYALTCVAKWSPRADIEVSLADMRKEVEHTVYKLADHVAVKIRVNMEKEKFIEDHSDMNFDDPRIKPLNRLDDFVQKLEPWVSLVCIYASVYRDGYSNSPNSKIYEMTTLAFPEDPRYGDPQFGDTVEFDAYSLGELRDQVANYREDYSRVNYDY